MSLLPRQLQQRHLHTQPLLLKCPGTNLSLPACQETPPGIQRGKCSTITPLPCQGNHYCHQKLAATLQANVSANKGLLHPSWVVLLIPRSTEYWIMVPFVFVCEACEQPGSQRWGTLTFWVVPLSLCCSLKDHHRASIHWLHFFMSSKEEASQNASLGWTWSLHWDGLQRLITEKKKNNKTTTVAEEI